MKETDFDFTASPERGSLSVVTCFQCESGDAVKLSPPVIKRKGNRNPKKIRKVKVKKLTLYMFTKINLQRIRNIPYRSSTLGKCKSAYELAIKILSYIAQFQKNGNYRAVPVLQSDYVELYSKGTVTEVIKSLMKNGLIERDKREYCFNYTNNHSYYYDIHHSLLGTEEQYMCDFKRVTKDGKKLAEIERRRNGDDELREEYISKLSIDPEELVKCPCCDNKHKVYMFSINKTRGILNPICYQCWYDCPELAKVETEDRLNRF